PGKTCVLGAGMVIDPATLIEEIDACKARGLLANDADLVIGERAHVILRFHKDIDRLRESRAGAIGTTKRGIGPAYEAKVARGGTRMGDLVRPERLRALITQNLDELNPYLERLGGQALAVEDLHAEALAHGHRLERYFGDAGRVVYDAMRKRKS